MVIGMATRKVTITLSEKDVDRIRALVEDGSAASVSGFVQHAVGVALDDVAGWGALLAEALDQTGGPLTDDERAWADEVLGRRDPGSTDVVCAHRAGQPVVTSDPGDLRRLGPTIEVLAI